MYYDSGKMQGKPKFAVKHNRRKENLSLYLIDKPCTPAERQLYQRFKKVIRYAIDHDVMLKDSCKSVSCKVDSQMLRKDVLSPEEYTRAVDKLKEEAINSLPELRF